jgi:zinc D-Ala-D-Ala dipeptidase
MRNLICFSFIILLGFSCGNPIENKSSDEQPLSLAKDIDTVQDLLKENSSSVNSLTDLEERLTQLGLVNVSEIDPSIVIDIRYSTSNNFMGMDVYGDFDEAWLQADVAEKLKKAQEFLKSNYPDYSLIVYDAVRPLHIQQKMWDLVEMPVAEKGKYLSNPSKGSVHNYGAAVDLSIVDGNGEALDMGTDYDFFGEESHPAKEAEMLKAGKINQVHIDNRKILRNAMRKAGFSNIPAEWWHFNSCNREEAKRKYPLIE